MALTYKEEKALIKEGADYLADGHSYQEWKSILSERGMYPFAIERLGFEIDKELGDRATDKMLPEIDAGGPVVNHYGLADDVFARVKQQQEAHFRKILDAQARQLQRAGRTEAEILAEINHPLYTADDVSHVLEKETKRKEFNSSRGGIWGASGNQAILLGSIFIGVGLLLSAVMSDSGVTTVFFGAILIGALLLFKGLFERN